MASLTPQTEADCGELECGEEVVGPPVVACSDAAEMLDAIEEPLDEVALAVNGAAEQACSLWDHARRHIGPCTAGRGVVVDCIGVVSPVGDQDRALPEIAKQLAGRRRVALPDRA